MPAASRRGRAKPRRTGPIEWTRDPGSEYVAVVLKCGRCGAKLATYLRETHEQATDDLIVERAGNGIPAVEHGKAQLTCRCGALPQYPIEKLESMLASMAAPRRHAVQSVAID